MLAVLVDTVPPTLSPETLIAAITVLALSIFLGFELISKVPPTLHTPLMSGANAISGITIVGALTAASVSGGFGLDALSVMLGSLALALATINVVGGFMVTGRMLSMFKKKEDRS
ncbi:MAG TPA: NAD(P) transhydrogenase subunit alpha [Planctomycetes bacterium]|nr:NAD(P) transhydrogenase subunit alpha [Planctomycetota bacterium]HIL36166.1 NAD(P) transhydrogenase subunit alpha [Planctomycetota bacterium]